MPKIRDGSRGIDCPRQLLPSTIQGVLNDGYAFAVRYLSRAAYVNPSDVRGIEADTIRRMGLALGFVQHCPPEKQPWTPSVITSRADGYSAIRQLHAIGVPAGKTVWFDLENVAPNSSPLLVEDCVNGWSEIVDDAGYQSGVYVGDGCLLDRLALYHNLRVTRYWAAYNLDRDRVPAVRGVCMQQHPYHPGRSWADINVVCADAMGDVPSFWEPGE
jgi:hypothetical protein